MIVSIHQPSFWPWIGLLDKIAKSDCHIILDDVAANKDAFQYRNKFYCGGKAKFLTLPVNYKKGKIISELEFNRLGWQSDQINKLKNYYRKARFLTPLMDALEAMYLVEGGTKPVDLIVATMKYALSFLNVDVKLLKSSELNINGKKSDKLLGLCKKINADVYLSGKGALAYMTQDNIKAFAKNGIEVRWQSFQHPVYDQEPDYPFVEGLACFDLFAFHDVGGAQKIFWRNL